MNGSRGMISLVRSRTLFQVSNPKVARLQGATAWAAVDFRLDGWEAVTPCELGIWNL
jgi:hypothetical protein